MQLSDSRILFDAPYTSTLAPAASLFYRLHLCVFVTYPLSLALIVISLHYTGVILAIVLNRTGVGNTQNTHHSLLNIECCVSVAYSLTYLKVKLDKVGRFNLVLKSGTDVQRCANRLQNQINTSTRSVSSSTST